MSRSNIRGLVFVSSGLLAFLLITLSCSRVNFGKVDKGSDPGGGDVPVTPLSAISCSVSLSSLGKSDLSSVRVTATAENPMVLANCTPFEVTYTWTVTKNPATPVTINGLFGSKSQADFFAAGNGTYSIVLTATAPGRTSYTSSALTVEVADPSIPNPSGNIACDVKLNDTQTTVTVSSLSQNPKVKATCTPADGAYVWTVIKGSVSATVTGLNGSESTPDFYSLGAGEYHIYLRVTKSGYNSYELNNPLVVKVLESGTRDVSTSRTVTVSENQLDILLVVDDSNSMLADNQKMAAKLQGFVNDLTASGFDWQMCVTTTRAQRYSASDPNYYWGASVVWSGQTGDYPWVLKPSVLNLNQVFANTIDVIGAGWVGSDDERGIKAAWWHLWNGDPSYSPNSNCYRRDAGLGVVIISDEDERSIGGDLTQQYYFNELKALENDDLPRTYVDYVRSVFGPQKRFSVNSIIVRPGDNGCMVKQDTEGSKSHFGTKYAELSAMTGGYTASICDSDFTVNMQYFKDRIARNMRSLALECNPVGNISVSFDPGFTTNYSVSNMTMTFDPAVPVGTKVTVNYKCPK